MKKKLFILKVKKKKNLFYLDEIRLEELKV